MKKAKNSPPLIDVIILVTTILVHLCAYVLPKSLLSYICYIIDIYLGCFGLAWAVLGFFKNRIIREETLRGKLFEVFFIGITLSALLWAVDCTITYFSHDLSPLELLLTIGSTAKYTVRHIGLFYIAYAIRFEFALFIQNVKKVGLLNAIFEDDEEDEEEN